MTFDMNRFRAANLSPRQLAVPVPDLKHFFDDGVEPLWVLRGLTGEEIARANEENQKQTLIVAAVEALASSASAKADQVDAIKALIGQGSEVPADMAKRLTHLVFCSVDPAIDREIAVRLFNSFPIIAYQLTNKILELTGMGPDLGKA
jgi:hypothetical protein